MHYTTSCNTQSSAPEDGQNNRPKHVELNGIINKPLLLHPVGVYIMYNNDARSSKYQMQRYFGELLHKCEFIFIKYERACFLASDAV